MLEREYCIAEQAPTIIAFLIALCAIVVLACSCFLVAMWGAQFRVELRTDIDVLGDWRESVLYLNANSLVMLSFNKLETTQKKLSRLTTVVDKTMILWPSGPWVGGTDSSEEFTASIFMVTELFSVDSEIIRRINSGSYRGWFEVVWPVTATKGGKRDVNVLSHGI